MISASWAARTDDSAPSLCASSTRQPRQQNGQVEVSTPSGLPSHFETLSASAPVGQTETQAPQNSQPAATCEAPKAGPISVARAAVLERQHRGAAHLVAHAHAAPAQDAEVVVAVVERVVVLGFEAAVGDRVADLVDADPLRPPAAARSRRRSGQLRQPVETPALRIVVRLRRQSSLSSHSRQLARVLGEDQPQDLLAHLAQGDGVGGDLHALGGQRAAGQRVAARALDLDRAQAAAAERR